MGVAQWWRRLTGRKDDPGQPVLKTRSGRSGPRPTPGTGAAARPAPLPPPGRPAPIDPSQPVLGLVPGRSGWVAAALDASGHGTPQVLAGDSAADLVARLGAVTVVAVGVPVGLPDSSRRAADGETRRFLGPQASAVVGAPVRDAVYAASDSEAQQANRERTGSGVSRQAGDLRGRIVEVDRWLRRDLPFRVVEVNPEVSLRVMTGEPMTGRRSSAAGIQERRDALTRAGIYVPTSAPHGVSAEDVVAACAAAWTAHRVKTGQARTFPEQPETFSDGIPAAVHA